MSQQPVKPADPQLEILLVEESLIELQGKVVAAQNNLYSAQKMRDESEPGSTSESVAETEIEEICSQIDIYNAEIERLETEHRGLLIQIQSQFRNR